MADLKKRIAQAAAEAEASDLRSLMNSIEGRRFIWRLLSKAGIFRTSLNSDAILMAGAEGQRNLGLFVYGELQSECPDLYLTMQAEAIDRAKAEKLEVENERASRNADDDN